MNTFKLCRFQYSTGQICIGLLRDATLFDLTPAGVARLTDLLERPDLLSSLSELAARNLPAVKADGVQLLAPVERQEVWAAGVTYLRSKKARMEESEFSANAYDLVYEAARPELFFKALPEKVVATKVAIGIRKDAKWNVPEPELALVITSKGRIAGFTIGNDMSSRDIEGENLLYLPQAKVYSRSCALGPVVVVGVEEKDARGWKISVEIMRDKASVFKGETNVGQMKRSFSDLVSYLFRSQEFPNGAVLLTGTGVVPPDTFTLREGDWVTIEIEGIGTLTNPVISV